MPSPPPRMNIPPTPAKASLIIEIEFFPRCVISHEN